MTYRAALIQTSSSDDPARNLPVTEKLVREAAAGGADFIATPEVTNIISMSRARQSAVLRSEADDKTLSRLRSVAAELGVHLLIGSLALSGESPDGRFVNRSFLIGPAGEIIARYDKIHMFDAAPKAGESYRESAGYRPGEEAVLADTALGRIGLTICYDMRFPELYARLARAGQASSRYLRPSPGRQVPHIGRFFSVRGPLKPDATLLPRRNAVFIRQRRVHNGKHGAIP